MNYYDFKKIKKEFSKKISRKYRINYLNINNINLKIKNLKNIIFLIKAELNEIEKLNKTINLVKTKYFIEDENLNIIFIYENSNKSIDYYILKNFYRKNNILGKIKINKNERKDFYGIKFK